MNTVVLLTDEAVLAYGLRAMVEDVPGWSLAHVCRDAAEFVRLAELAAPDILILTPQTELAQIRELSHSAPETRFVMWARDISIELAYQALEMGVRGVVSTKASTEMLGRCLNGVARGEMWMEQDLTMHLLTSRPVALTRRQSELLRLLVQGLKNKEIAAHLGISEGTVKAYMTRLFEKVGAKDRFELALFGLKNMSHLRAEAETPPYGNLRSIVLPRAQRQTA